MGDESGVRFDIADHYEEFAEIRSLVTAGAWPGVEDILTRWRSTDPGAVVDAAWMIAELPGADELLAAQTSSSSVRAVQCVRWIGQAWEIRTSARAEDVSEDQFRRFHAKLQETEQVLVDLAARDPSDTLVASIRLATARGLGLGVNEAERRYRRVATRQPFHLPAQRLYLQFLAPRWYGSTEAMFDFARDCVTSAPAGSSAGTLIAEAQLEQWLELGDDGPAFLAEPKNHEELLAAEEASVFHLDYDDGLHWVYDHSIFASVHSFAGRHDDAAHHFTVLDDVAAQTGWRFFDDPAQKFREDREMALGKEVSA